MTTKTEDKNKEFNNLKKLLKNINSNDGKLIKITSNSNDVDNSPTDENVLSYIYNIFKSPDNIIMENTAEEVTSDEESVYEDETTVTKTIFRSNSFDDPIDDLFSTHETSEENNECNSHSTVKSKEFTLHDFSDSFNLSEEEMEADIEMVTQIAPAARNSKKEEEHLSISSDGSIQFDDVIAGDILGDLAGEEVMGAIEGFNIKPSVDEQRIVDAIISKLNQQLKPTLDKLSEESKKYELVKIIYKLPSISNINLQIRDHFTKQVKPKNFKLEFQQDTIKSMIGKELGNKKNKISYVPMVSETDQVRINFNKCRQLNTIVEETSFDNSHSSIDAVKYMEPMSNNLKNTGFIVEVLKAEQPDISSKLVEKAKSKENKVGKLVSMFESSSW